MKQVTYRIPGRIEDADVSPIMAACAAVPGVRRVQLSPIDEANTLLILHMTSEPMNTQEELLVAALEKHGATLLLETRTVTDEDVPILHEKKPKTVTLGSAIAAMAVVVAMAVLLTFALTTRYLLREVPPTVSAEPTVFDQMELLDRLFRDMTVYELDENFEDTLLKAYVAATGDEYAEYFTAEELEAMNDRQNGEMCGIGITVVNSTHESAGESYLAIVISNVYADSPAEEAGVLPGDIILYVGIGEERVSIDDIGYTEALSRMSGEEGTTCSFTVLRYNVDTTQYDEVELSAVRRKLTVRYVVGRVYTSDPTVGVIRITEFQDPTATQFVETVEELKAQGCTRFVLDLRGNPGGMLTSVEDMLTFFLQEGDIMISTKGTRDTEPVPTRLEISQNGTVLNGSGTLTKEDVGKYRDLNFTVLVNGYSASAAELFTANMRDYELATIVGTKTFGKGSMQSTIPLTYYGYEGALKLTIAYYYPPSGESYHGKDKGITPHVLVEMDEALKNVNINLLTDEQDNQLAAAVQALKPAA